jgi:cardiolipin synthase
MTFANFLTVLRLAVIPFFIMALVYDHPKVALWLFLAAGITDILDGFIARYFNQKTALGAFLDPAADKLMLTATYVTMAIPATGLAFTIPVWLPVLTIARDVVIVLITLMLHLTFGIRNFPPTVPGKATTLFQISYAVGILLKNSYGLPGWLLTSLLWSVGFLTVFSGLHYILRMKVMIRSAG